MAGDVSTNNIRIGANIAGLLEGMKKASAAVRGTVLDMNSRLVDSYKRANKEQGVFRGGLLKLGDDLQGLAGKMAVFGTLPALFAAGKSYKDYGELEKLEKGLTRYGETIKGVREIAKLPNVGVFDAAKNLIGLKAMKIDSDLATRSIKAFANAITDAGGSAIDLDPALVNLKQFKSTRNINTVDLRQLGNRIPQTMDAMQSAFNTTDAEKLNKIMAKIGTDGFIDKFITELEKIPPAASGAATAQEQLGDSFLFFSGTIGKGLDSAYGITDAIKGLGNALDNLSDNFSNLTPEAQKSIFTIGALAIAMPAIIGTVGGLIKLMPLLASGFTAVLGPIAAFAGVSVGAVVAAGVAIGVAVAAIINNWDSIKKFLTETGWWNSLAGIVSGTLGIITEAFKVVINLIQGDWSNLGKALINILKNTGNVIITVLGGIAKGFVGVFTTAALSLFAVFDKNTSFSDVGKGVNAAVSGLDGFIQSMKFDVPDAVGFAKKGIEAVTGSVTGGIPPVKKLTASVGEAAEAYVKMSEAAFKMWQIDIASKWYEEQKALKDKIQGYKELLGVTANLNVELLKLSKPAGSRLGDSNADGLDRAKSILGGVGDRKTGNTLTGMNNKRDSELSPYNNGMSIGSWKDVNQKYLDEAVKGYRDAASATSNLNMEIIQSFDGLKSSLAEGIGETFGNMLSGVGVNMEDIGKGLFTIFGDLLTRLGKGLIAYSAVVKGLMAAIKTMNPWVALGAGVLAIAAGKALKNSAASMGSSAASSMTAFADGGLAYKDMVARVGDNRNARFDPEMIAPYSKVDSSIKKSVAEAGGGGGGRWEQTHIELRGDTIRIALERNARMNNSLNGRKS